MEVVLPIDMRSREAGIVIVTYESADVIESCLRACAVLGFPVVVVDNASSDGTPELVQRSWPGVRLIANQDNRGFAAACNQGTAALATETVLLAESGCGATDAINGADRGGASSRYRLCHGEARWPGGLDQRGFAFGDYRGRHAGGGGAGTESYLAGQSVEPPLPVSRTAICSGPARSSNRPAPSCYSGAMRGRHRRFG